MKYCKPGYAKRQYQREFAAKLLMNGFAPEAVSGYAERKYGLSSEVAAAIVKQVKVSLSKGGDSYRDCWGYA